MLAFVWVSNRFHRAILGFTGMNSTRHVELSLRTAATKARKSSSTSSGERFWAMSLSPAYKTIVPGLWGVSIRGAK